MCREYLAEVGELMARFEHVHPAPVSIRGPWETKLHFVLGIASHYEADHVNCHTAVHKYMPC